MGNYSSLTWMSHNLYSLDLALFDYHSLNRQTFAADDDLKLHLIHRSTVREDCQNIIGESSQFFFC